MLNLGVYLSLREIFYANRSIIFANEIGETDVDSLSPPPNSNNGLQCITDRIPCCRSHQNRTGEWFFPNGTVVPIRVNAETFYRNRGQDGTVNLNHLNTNVMSPGGLFCCVVPDATGINRTLCANIGI